MTDRSTRKSTPLPASPPVAVVADSDWRQELETLVKRRGTITRIAVVEWAVAHPDSALYQQFDWNDASAANTARLLRAGELLRRVRIIISRAPDRELPLVVHPSRGDDYTYTGQALAHDEEALQREEARILLSHLRRYAAWPWPHPAWVTTGIRFLEKASAVEEDVES